MRLSEKLEDCIRFATFALEHKVALRDLAELIALAARAQACGIREANCGSREPTAKARAAFNKKAHDLRFTVDWGGNLWPVLARDGKSVYLPDLT